jgi:hypothetical protein
VGRRGPGGGLRQAGSVVEAREWLCLFDALGSAHAAPLLPHLSLRAADAAALAELCPRAAASLRRVLAETAGAEALDHVNGVLAGLYGEIEARLGARVARSVFALASEGFPEEAEQRLLQRWDQPLRMLLRDYADSGLPESKRDVVTAMVGHHIAEMDALHDAVTHGGVDGEDAARAGWLLTLVQWRRFASLGRALARVLSTSEREQLGAFTRAVPVRRVAQARDQRMHRAG